jgi:hypothetical protein
VNDKNRVNHESYYEIHLRHWTPESEIVNVYGVLNLAVASINDRTLEIWGCFGEAIPMGCSRSSAQGLSHFIRVPSMISKCDQQSSEGNKGVYKTQARRS